MWHRLTTWLAGSWLGTQLLALWVKREKARLRAHERAVLLDELRRWENEGGGAREGDKEGRGPGSGTPPGKP
jgi:hypothetical protein